MITREGFNYLSYFVYDGSLSMVNIVYGYEALLIIVGIKKIREAHRPEVGD